MPPATQALPIERWPLRLQLAQPLHHSEHAGSLLRGAFGHALRALACPCGAGDVHQPDCHYRAIFEPAPPADWPTRYRDCPPAYVISPPAPDSGARRQLDFQFTLLGPACTRRTLVWQAWQQAATTGLGSARIPAQLQALPAASGLPAAPTGTTLGLQLTSPLLLKRKSDGQRSSQPLQPHNLTLDDLLIALHRRLSLTRQLYGVPAAPLPALEQWLAEARTLTFSHRLHPCHYRRHSNRQRQRMPLYGLGGEITLVGALSPALRQALALGQWLHIGGKTALGLGGYRLREYPEDSEQRNAHDEVS